MKKVDYSKKTTAKLNADLKGVKVITGALIGILSLIFIVVVYGLLAKDENGIYFAILAIVMLCSVMIPICYGYINAIK